MYSKLTLVLVNNLLVHVDSRYSMIQKYLLSGKGNWVFFSISTLIIFIILGISILNWFRAKTIRLLLFYYSFIFRRLISYEIKSINSH